MDLEREKKERLKIEQPLRGKKWEMAFKVNNILSVISMFLIEKLDI